MDRRSSYAIRLFGGKAKRRLKKSRRERLRRQFERVELALEPLEEQDLLAVFAVNSTVDAVDLNPGDGVVETSTPGEVTLCAAVMEANALAGPDEIVLADAIYEFTLSGANEDGAAQGDLDIYDQLTITGDPLGSTTIDAAALDRVLHVHPARRFTFPT